MPFVSVTRLRLRGWLFLPRFLFANGLVSRQLARAPGFLGGRLLMDAGRVFWTVSVWQDKAAMLAFRNGGPHGKAMPKLQSWADHARVAHWDQERNAPPTWEELFARLKSEGRDTKLKHAAPDHGRPEDFPAPRSGGWREQRIEPAPR